MDDSKTLERGSGQLTKEGSRQLQGPPKCSAEDPLTSLDLVMDQSQSSAGSVVTCAERDSVKDSVLAESVESNTNSQGSVSAGCCSTEFYNANVITSVSGSTLSQVL